MHVDFQHVGHVSEFLSNADHIYTREISHTTTYYHPVHNYVAEPDQLDPL